jgi:recombination protein RecT
MSNTQLTISQALNSTDAKTKFQELLGKRSTQFITSVLSVVNNNALLKNASWQSIYQAAITAATLDLPINQNLGFAYIVPYKEKGEGVAQFQMGYKGFIQLAQRTGLYKTINVSDVREGEIEEFDRLTGQIKFNWIQDDSRLNKKIIGYVSYFELLNGFSKLLYMTIEELEKHGSTFSKSYNSTKTDCDRCGWRVNQST